MSKTGEEIEVDVRNLLLDANLPITGDIYYDEDRPRDSKEEDVSIIFTSAVPVGDFLEGVVTLNIAVPDIDPYDNGAWIKNKPRCRELERYAQEWVESLTADKSEYRWSLQQAIHTTADRERREHFIVIRLSFSYLIN